MPNQVYYRSLMQISSKIAKATFQKTTSPTHQKDDTILQRVQKQRKKAAETSWDKTLNSKQDHAEGETSSPPLPSTGASTGTLAVKELLPS